VLDIRHRAARQTIFGTLLGRSAAESPTLRRSSRPDAPGTSGRVTIALRAGGRPRATSPWCSRVLRCFPGSTVLESRIVPRGQGLRRRCVASARSPPSDLIGLTRIKAPFPKYLVRAAMRSAGASPAPWWSIQRSADDEPFSALACSPPRPCAPIGSTFGAKGRHARSSSILMSRTTEEAGADVRL